MPRTRHACTETILGIIARFVSVSVAVWEYGPGQCLCRFKRSDTPEGDVYTRMYYQAVSEPRVSVYLHDLASLLSALHPLILTQLPVSIIPALLVVTRERK